MNNETPQSDIDVKVELTEADYAYIGRHLTESINTIPHHYPKLLWHLFRQASEHHGSEFAQRLRDCFIAGTPSHRGIIKAQFKTATASVRVKERKKLQKEAVRNGQTVGAAIPTW